MSHARKVTFIWRIRERQKINVEFLWREYYQIWDLMAENHVLRNDVLVLSVNLLSFVQTKRMYTNVDKTVFSFYPFMSRSENEQDTKISKTKFQLSYVGVSIACWQFPFVQTFIQMNWLVISTSICFTFNTAVQSATCLLCRLMYIITYQKLESPPPYYNPLHIILDSCIELCIHVFSIFPLKELYLWLVNPRLRSKT